jgi:hypothetical protein
MDGSPRRLIERRQHKRIALPPGSLLSFTAINPSSLPGEQEGDGTVVNLSYRGCQLVTEAAVLVGRDYNLIIQVPALPHPLTIDCATVRWADANAFGLKFELIQREQEEQLREFLHQLRSTAA